MKDVLLPRTDAGALVQSVVVVALLVGALVLVRRNRDYRTFVVGLLVFMLALFGLRSIH